MSNREDLLAAAISCLRTKGYGRTTARDVATAAKTSLAAIGYHYGGLGPLLNEAAHVSIERWGDEVQQRLRAEGEPGQSYLDRFTDIWRRVIESVNSDRAIWAVSALEMLGQVDHVPEIRDLLRGGMHNARTGNVAMFDAVDEETVDTQQEKTVGSVYYALQLGVIMQWLLDPDNAPTASDLTEGILAIVNRIRDSEQASA